jgi:hypothetical protein
MLNARVDLELADDLFSDFFVDDVLLRHDFESAYKTG